MSYNFKTLLREIEVRYITFSYKQKKMELNDRLHSVSAFICEIIKNNFMEIIDAIC